MTKTLSGMETQIDWTLDYVLIFCLDEKLLDFTPLWNKYLMTLKKKHASVGNSSVYYKVYQTLF